jgi:hypothetical protein
MIALTIGCIGLVAPAACDDKKSTDEDTAVDTTDDTTPDTQMDTSDDPAPDDGPTADDPGETEPTYDINGVLETVDGFEVMRVWGTRDEMGYAEGALLCGRITRLMKEYALDYAVAGTGVSYEVVQGFASAFFTIPEPHERQLRGMILGMQERCDPADLVVTSDYLEAAAGGSREITYQDLFVAHVLPDYLCSSLTVWGDASPTGNTIHARNLDFLLDPAGVFVEEHMLKVYRSSEEGNATYASVSFPAMIGCISCFSSEGVGFTMHNVDGLPDTTPTGNIPRTLAMRDALVATVGAVDKIAAAEAVFDACPQVMGNNLHMSQPCDGTGGCVGAAVFEFDGAASYVDGHATCRMPGDVSDGLNTANGLVVTNHYMKRDTPPTTGGSYDRYQAIVTGVNDDLAADGTISSTDALAYLKETADLNAGSPTVHSVIMDVSTMTLLVYVGSMEGSTFTEAPYNDPYTLDLGAIFASYE